MAWSSPGYGENSAEALRNPWKYGLIRVRDLKRKKTFSFRKDYGPAVSLAFSPNEKRLAAGHKDGFVRIWDLHEGHLIRRMLAHVPRPDGYHRVIGGHPQCYVYALAFSPDSKLLASGAWDGRVRIWNEATGNLLADLPGHASGIRAVAFSRDGKKLASGSYDCTVIIWDVPSAIRQLQ